MSPDASPASPRAPRERVRTRVPQVMQMEALECGAASLDMILAYHGKWVPLPEVRAALGISRDGATAKSIAQGARSFGLEAKVCRYYAPSLREKVELPCIAFWDGCHFVVVTGYSQRHVYINNPAGGPEKYTWDEFARHYGSIVIMCKPGEGFEPGGAAGRACSRSPRAAWVRRARPWPSSCCPAFWGPPSRRSPPRRPRRSWTRYSPTAT